MQKTKVGVVGCGAISAQYFAAGKNFPIMEYAACADLNMEMAKARAKEFGVPKVCTVDELLADKSIDIVLNLTIPKAHVEVALRSIESGKHTYAEKPLGISRAEGQKLMDAAKKNKKLVGCAPDTFLGAGIQTARKLLDDGAIGRPVAFTAFMMGPGVEHWHPNPPFYYEVGGGPMFDMGPYYLTALLNLLGPVKRMIGGATIAIPQRLITHKDKDGAPGPMYGKTINVETPDFVSGILEFTNGAVGTIITSFATRFAEYSGKQPITIFGTEGTMRVPDPNGFDGPVAIRKNDDADWKEMPHTFVEGYGRAVGLADMAYAIKSGRAHRANGELAFAVLDLMQGFLESSAEGKYYTPTAPFKRPAPMPANLPFGTLDE